MTPEALIIESMFSVVDKDGKEGPFTLNSAQRLIDESLTGRDIIPKARQEGVSTYFLARYTAKCLSTRNVSAVIISHEGEATQRLLQRCQYFVQNLRGPAADVGRASLNVITFPKMNSRIYIGTAGAKKFGRGDTITHLHCSEYAYWPNPKELLGTLLQSVPMSGEVAIESTGNGIGNDYHRRAMRAFNKQSQWKCHFLDWQSFPEYSVRLSAADEQRVMNGLIEEWEEPELVEKFGLTAGQVVWRRLKLEEMDYDIQFFKQEYPMTIDECFQASGQSIFARVKYDPTKKWVYLGNYMYALEDEPNQRDIYIIGVDPSGGVGRDNSCIQIININKMEQVAEYAHNRIEPDILGEHVAAVARRFNNAFIVVESNNHGPVVLDAIRDAGYPEHLLYDMRSPGQDYEDPTLMRLGFRTTSRTKPIMIGELRRSLAKTLTIHSPSLRDELSTFIEHENGTLAAQEGCYDDRVMALACANIGIERAGIMATPSGGVTQNVYKDPFLLDNIIDEMGSRRSGFPISSQTEWKS